MDPRRVSFFLVGLVSLSCVACEARVSLGGSCVYDSECPGLSCRYGRCRAQCLADLDCGRAELRCIEGVCAAGSESCSSADPCEDPARSCAGSICATRCTTAGACPGDERCELRAGVPVCVPTDAPSPTHHQLCLGFEHACAIREGRVYCWGNDQAGQLGDGTSVSAPTTHGALCPPDVLPDAQYDCATSPLRPVQRRTGPATAAPLEGVVSISCGEAHTCALTGSGEVLCWGYAGGPELGLGMVTLVGFVAQQTIASGATELTLGRAHGCARVGDDYLCWGQNARRTTDPYDNRLGLRPTEDVEVVTPTPAPDFAGATALSAGGYFTCALEPSSLVRCRGSNDFGVTGSLPAMVDVEGADHIVGVRDVLEVSSGVSFACARGADDSGTTGVYCWGDNASGQLAAATRTTADCGGLCRREAAAIVAMPPLGSVAGLSHGVAGHMCAFLETSGEVYCWGGNGRFETGVDSGATERVDAVESPVETAPGTRLVGVVEVATGQGASCARTRSGEVYCWGANHFGQLGLAPPDLDKHRLAHLVTFPAP